MSTRVAKEVLVECGYLDELIDHRAMAIDRAIADLQEARDMDDKPRSYYEGRLASAYRNVSDALEFSAGLDKLLSK